MKAPLLFSPNRRRQQGAATIVAVMALFLVMALLAAYANRSLMFEQRISGSYYRASMAQEMAEGGIEWTVAMLNGTAIDGACQAVATGGTRFSDKYLNISATDRAITDKVGDSVQIVSDCSRTDAGMVCRCPQPGTRTAQPAAAVTTALVPTVGIAMGADSRGPTPGAPGHGSVLLTSYGCTSSSVDNCFGVGATAESRSQKAAAMAQQSAGVGFIAAVPSSPAAPLTVRGQLTVAGAGGLGLHNSDPQSAGMLVVSGGNPATLSDDRMDSVPGTPSGQVRIFDDDALRNMTGSDGEKRFFRTFMGMQPARYKNHPAARTVACPGGGGDCGAALVTAVDAGKRMLLVNGSMSIGSNVVIGSAAAPVLIVVYGPVTINGPLQLNGMLVVLGDLDWTNASAAASLINGMVLVQGDMHTDGRMDIAYRQSIADELRNRLGSFARVSGGWIDGDTL